MKHKWNGQYCERCNLKKGNKNSRQAYSKDEFKTWIFNTPSCLILSDDETYCPKCNTIKKNDQFIRDKSRPNGLTGVCTKCKCKASRIWNLNNPEKYKAISKRRRTSAKGREATRKHRKDRYLKNKGTFMDFYWTIRLIPRRVIKLYQGGRYTVPIKHLGCTREQFIKHLESQFRDGMTWGNYGTVWQVDHIHPYGLIDKRDREALIKNCHWTNTQPLLIHENAAKGKTHLIFQ